MSGQKPGSRFTDYFVVCGLDVEAGLEPDQLSGKFARNFCVYIKYVCFCLGRKVSHLSFKCLKWIKF